MNTIDFVIAWVDGSDPAWIKEKLHYARNEDRNSLVNRYRDWELLPYWFRAVEKFAPWVHKIHFVTWGHYPKWLNIQHPKLNIIKHIDYIPEEYLPTFSSHPIELNFHRIPDLTEQFVYFNDDMFLTREVVPADFFRDQLPCDAFLEDVICSEDVDNIFSHILLNDVAFINKHFCKSDVITRRRKQYFHIKYKSGLIKNIFFSNYKNFVSFYWNHLPSPLLKSTLKEVWDCDFRLLNRVCQNKFRDIHDVNQYIFRYWQYMTGKFHPIDIQTFGQGFSISNNNTCILDAIRSQKYKMICINDNGTDYNYEAVKKELIAAFDSILSKRSSFEI